MADRQNWLEGLDLFLRQNCTEPAAMLAALKASGLVGRVDRLNDRDVLCREEEPADCYWVICEGHIRIESRDQHIVLRGPGEVIGEQAFYRPERGSGGFPVRGACMLASGDARVLKVDKALVEKLNERERGLWHEAMARAMCRKLDEATGHRRSLHEVKREYSGLIKRFVCSDGREAALAALEGIGGIDPQQSTAVVWFSDIKGFSVHSATLSPTDVAATVQMFMEVQAEEIAKAGGQIDKFMGDGLMAFWPAPDDDRLNTACQSAVSAATRSAERLAALISKSGLPLDIRIGLHAGEVIFGDFGGAGRIAFTCTGQTVNEAARYEQAATDINGSALGRVRVSRSMFTRIKDKKLRRRFGPEVEFADKHHVHFFAHTTLN